MRRVPARLAVHTTILLLSTAVLVIGVEDIVYCTVGFRRYRVREEGHWHMAIDFVDWCGLVLQTCVHATKTSENARGIGVSLHEIAAMLCAALGTTDYSNLPEFPEITFGTGLIAALGQLSAHDLLEHQRNVFRWKVTRYGRELATDLLPLWLQICQEPLDEEHEELLRVVNRLSPQTALDHVWLKYLQSETLVGELGWDKDVQRLCRVGRDLNEWGFITGRFWIGGVCELAANYHGLVWETRRGMTVVSRFIDNLVEEWETTSVEFKRELYLDMADQKAELIKDILALANTRASGRHWLIVGFDNNTHKYSRAPDPTVTQDRIERVVATYTSPCVDLKYEVVPYQAGPVGMLEVFRDPKKVPYRVSKTIKGDKKSIQEGTIFVRHNTIAEPPTPAEELVLHEEGDRARALP